jgi:hypothetical protein
MRPIDDLESAEARRLRGLLFDLDDTLLERSAATTTDGTLSELGYAALFELRRAGLELFIVTGRPAAWGDVLLRLFPVDGAVTENGGTLLRRRGSRVEYIDELPPPERALAARRLADLVSELHRRFSELVPADDVRGRISDYTFDIGEHRRVERAIVDEAAALAVAGGAFVVRSSVHLHVSFTHNDKALGALRLVSAVSGRSAEQARSEYAYIGDSENDRTCFETFETSIGVANLTPGVGLSPRYVTRSERGAGFAEAARVLAARRVL